MLTEDREPCLAHTFLDLHVSAWSFLCLLPSNKAALNAIKLQYLEKVAWSSKAEIWLKEVCCEIANQLLETEQILWDSCWWIDLRTKNQPLMIFWSVYFGSETDLFEFPERPASIFTFAKPSVDFWNCSGFLVAFVPGGLNTGSRGREVKILRFLWLKHLSVMDRQFCWWRCCEITLEVTDSQLRTVMSWRVYEGLTTDSAFLFYQTLPGAIKVAKQTCAHTRANTAPLSLSHWILYTHRHTPPSLSFFLSPSLSFLLRSLRTETGREEWGRSRRCCAFRPNKCGFADKAPVRSSDHTGLPEWKRRVGNGRKQQQQTKRCRCMGIWTTVSSFYASRLVDSPPWLSYKSSPRLHYHSPLPAYLFYSSSYYY